MAARIIRAHYDQLTQTATRFGQQAGEARGLLQRLRRDLDLLQGGDWLGQGAQAFYAEMNGQVVPAVQRLVRALEQAADTTYQINQVVQQAEQAAAACLRVEGGGAAVGTAAGLGTSEGFALPGPVSADAASFIGGRADANGGGAATAKSKARPKAPVAPVVKGAADKQGQVAYNHYLIDYTKYLRQQSQSWDRKTVAQKFKEQIQTSRQLMQDINKQVVPVVNQLDKLDQRGADDPALRQKALDLIHQHSNRLAKAQSELLVVDERAHALRLETGRVVYQDRVVTDAEADQLHDRLRVQQGVEALMETNNWMAEYLHKMRTDAVGPASN